MAKDLGRDERIALGVVDVSGFKTDEQRIYHLLSFGTFAPSTHNTQPWKIKFTLDGIELHADFSKRIPEADPSGRDLYMSIGAFLKNVELAGKGYGLDVAIAVHANDGQEHVATIQFAGLSRMTETDDKLLEAILDRQNYRGYFGGNIDENRVEEVLEQASGDLVTATPYWNTEMKQKLANLTIEGLKLGYSNPAFRQEISSFINNNHSKKRYGLHGYSLRMNYLQSVIIPKIMKKKDIGPKLARKNKQSFDTAAGVVVLSAVDSPGAWIEAGRTLEEAMVRLTQIKVKASIYAAAIEMSDLRKQLAELVGTPNGVQPQLLFCVGMADKSLPYSLRKDLSEVILA